MGRRHLYDKEIREEAVARVMNGETLASIAGDLGTYPSTVSNWAIDAEMKRQLDSAREYMEATTEEPRMGIHPAMLREVMGL